MKSTDFHIGLEFLGRAGLWRRCTDVGTRTILAIRLDPGEDSNIIFNKLNLKEKFCYFVLRIRICIRKTIRFPWTLFYRGWSQTPRCWDGSSGRADLFFSWGAGGWRFKSSRPDQVKAKTGGPSGLSALSGVGLCPCGCYTASTILLSVRISSSAVPGTICAAVSPSISSL